MSEFYVYEHRRASDEAVFYIGKGKGKRAWSRDRNSHWRNVVAKHGLIVTIGYTNLSEAEAFALERQLINWHFEASSPLTNQTSGGEGGCLIGDGLLKMKAAINTPEVKQKHSSAVSAASLRAWSENKEDRVACVREALGKSIRCVETGQIFLSRFDAQQWLQTNINPKAMGAKIRRVLSGDRKSAYGFRWEYV